MTCCSATRCVYNCFPCLLFILWLHSISFHLLFHFVFILFCSFSTIPVPTFRCSLIIVCLCCAAARRRHTAAHPVGMTIYSSSRVQSRRRRRKSLGDVVIHFSHSNHDVVRTLALRAKACTHAGTRVLVRALFVRTRARHSENDRLRRRCLPSSLNSWRRYSIQVIFWSMILINRYSVCAWCLCHLTHFCWSHSSYSVFSIVVIHLLSVQSGLLL